MSTPKDLAASVSTMSGLCVLPSTKVGRSARRSMISRRLSVRTASTSKGSQRPTSPGSPVTSAAALGAAHEAQRQVRLPEGIDIGKVPERHR